MLCLWRSYTHALAEIDAGRLWKDTPAPPIAVATWGLPEEASMRGGLASRAVVVACVPNLFRRNAPGRGRESGTVGEP